MQAGNFGSAASDLFQFGSAGLSAPGALTGAEAVGSSGPTGAVLTGPAGLGGAPVLAGVGRASSVGGLSVPPSWASGAGLTSPTPATLAGAGWTTAAPQSTPVATMPAGMPSVASAGRGGLGFGAPRYGVKPTVMPKPAVV
ncbi:MAG: PE/PPE C-terminal domain-containing protein [Mycobacterium sp.]